jgi:hypothetical protein
VRSKILFAAILLGITACANHKGAISPNWSLADFDKYDAAYYLDLDQVRIGDTKDKVIEEYGGDYSVVATRRENEHRFERWKFTSYRATSMRDPVDKYVYVSFKDDLVIGKNEELVGRAAQSGSSDPVERIERLKALRDQGAISKDEYEAAKRKILERM